VISYHLQGRKYWVTVGYICYRGKEPSVKNELRPGGMSIVKQQGMEVLGVELSLSMSIKDRYLEPSMSFWTHAWNLAGRPEVADREA
jgi:hypothetical protein